MALTVNPNAGTDLVQVVAMVIVMMGTAIGIMYWWERRRKTRHTH